MKTLTMKSENNNREKGKQQAWNVKCLKCENCHKREKQMT